MRSGWDRDAHHLVFDVGPLGCPVSGGHGHADLLSIQCSAFGAPWIIDPGTYAYTREGAWRDFFRTSAAHSTVTVDGRSQAVPDGPFRWTVRPSARLTRWVSTDRLDFADAEHAAFGGLVDPVVHRRRVVFAKPRYWVVIDDLTGAAEHQVEVRFQFTRLDLTVDSDLWARARGAGGTGLLIRAFALVPLKAEVLDGSLEPIQGWTSPDYGRRDPAPLLRYTAVTRLPLRVVSLLLPTRTPDGPPPPVSLQVTDARAPDGLTFEDAHECLHWDDRTGVVLEDAPLAAPRAG
jgi:hypothetical protein